MSKFGAMREQRAARVTAVPETSAQPSASPGATRTSGRAGKKAISAYFSPEVSKAIHGLALEHDTTLQALMGEAIDLLMRQYGKHPFGER